MKRFGIPLFRILALIIGAIFLLLGILGFIPSFAPDNLLFGIFHINVMHNLVHILTGVVALWVGVSSLEGSKMFLQVFGILYILAGILGFGYGGRAIFGVIANNIADAWLHLFVGVLCVYFGFGLKSKRESLN